MMVFYPQERQGTCILCADLAHYQETTLESTRVYATTPAPPPPAYPHGDERHYTLLGGPSPPPPPNPPPKPPGRPPRPLIHLTRHHTRQHFECTYQPGTELSVDQSEGYTDRTAVSKEECCNMCGMKAGCQDFVFEPGSGTCVLLPHVSNELIVKSANEWTVSGSLQITVVKQNLEKHGECEFMPSSGFAGGSLGEGKPLPGGEPIESKVDCCDACDRTPLCVKFTYETYSKACILYEAYAETYMTDGLLSGIVVSRSMSSGALPGSAHAGGGSSYAGGGGPGVGEDLPVWMRLPPPPVPPTFSFSFYDAPPPLPPLETEGAASSVIAGMSMGIASLMSLGFCICAYCFFREDLLHVAEKASGGKVKRKRKGAYGVPGTVAPHDSDSDHVGKKAGRKGKGGAGKRGGRNNGEALEAGHVRVKFETSALSQKKDVDLRGVDDLTSLKDALKQEFGHSMKGKKEAMLYLCEGAESGEGKGIAWHLITRDSDIERVIESGSLKIMERPPNHNDNDFEVAFPNQATEGRGRRNKGRGSAVERFTDDEETGVPDDERFEDDEDDE